jgi:hypothetical protein
MILDFQGFTLSKQFSISIAASLNFSFNTGQGPPVSSFTVIEC